jgi:hypothetical protein
MTADEMRAAEDFRRHEMTVETASDRAWSRWLDKLVARMRADGVNVNDDMDGDGEADGYSLDQAYELFEERSTVDQAARVFHAQIRAARA